MRKAIYLISILCIFIGAILIYLHVESPTAGFNNEKKTIVKEKEKEYQAHANGEEIRGKKENRLPPDRSKESIVMKRAIRFFSKHPANAVAIGDSLTEGIGDTVGGGGYVGILDQSINSGNKLVRFLNYGRQGNRTSHLLSRLDDPIIKDAIRKADIILITIGANDIMQVVKENFTNLDFEVFEKERLSYEKRLTAIFDKIKQLNQHASVYLIGFYNPFEQYFQDIKELNIIVDNWNNAGEKITQEYKDVFFIPTKDIFDNTKVNLFAEDHFHPNHLGYQHMAQRILDYLIE